MKNNFEGCIIGGVIGDAWGSSYEFESVVDYSKTYIFGELPKETIEREWQITDDTQLTLATCEALCENSYTPEKLSKYFLDYYKANKLSGVGASTLKALRDLEVGIHWSLSGRTGEFSAGNGVAMRIAPFAFFSAISREDIYNATKITHKNDEAYVGALAVFLTIQSIVAKKWNGVNDLFEIIVNQLPDTKVRDRFIEISKLPKSTTIETVSKLGNNGYVVNSVPFAIYSATQVLEVGMSEMFEKIIQAGGDTDTNASIAGQIAGALIGIDNIPKCLIDRVKVIKEYSWIKGIIDKTILKITNEKE